MHKKQYLEQQQYQWLSDIRREKSTKNGTNYDIQSTFELSNQCLESRNPIRSNSGDNFEGKNIGRSCGTEHTKILKPHEALHVYWNHLENFSKLIIRQSCI